MYTTKVITQRRVSTQYEVLERPYSYSSSPPLLSLHRINPNGLLITVSPSRAAGYEINIVYLHFFSECNTVIQATVVLFFFFCTSVSGNRFYDFTY